MFAWPLFKMVKTHLQPSLVQVSCVAVEDEKDCCWRGWGLPGPVSDMCYMASGL